MFGDAPCQQAVGASFVGPNINESSNYCEAQLPFRGRSGSDSGIGRVGGNHVMQSFTELQTITITPSARRHR